MNSPRSAPTPADAIRRFAFGNCALDEWAAQTVDDPGEPWASFERARQLARGGQPEQAAEIWRQIAFTEGLPSRHILQAWHFLRQTGHQPPADRASLVLGAVAEVPVQSAHDMLAAYRDGTARYLNYSGKVAAVEGRAAPPVQAAIDGWLARAQVIADAIGPWDKEPLPSLPADYLRMMALTPGGLRFGQGPAAPLSADQKAGPFLAAAAALMRLIVSSART